MQFNEKFLEEVGLESMSIEEKAGFLAYIQEEAEIMVGKKISKGLSDVQLREFDMLTTQEDTLRWLEVNRPDFREIVTSVINDLKKEIIANRSKILA